MSKFDISLLSKAQEQLKLALDYAEEAKQKKDLRQYSVYRMAVIQAFEFCYETSIKTMKRYLQTYSTALEDPDAVKFRDLLRIASESGLLDNPLEWEDYRANRNLTSHTYDEQKAEKVMDAIPAFAKASAQLLSRIEERIRAS